MRHPQYPWSNIEIARLIGMHRRGFTNRRMATELGRTRDSVSNKLISLGLYKRKPCIGEDPIVHGIAISHDQIPAYYECGWRFTGFEGDLYRFEWLGKKPRYPAEAVRELEAA